MVYFCGDVQELARAFSQHPEDNVVWELAPGDDAGIAQVAFALRTHESMRRLLLCVDLRRSALRQVVAVAQHLPSASVWLRGQDDARGFLAEIHGDGPERGAISKIANRILPLVPERAGDITAAAIVAGRRRTRVQEFSRVCGISARTIGDRLSGSKLIHAENLLGWMVSLHSLWNLEVLGWSPKRVATSMGYDNRDTWSNYLVRHVGASPPRLLGAGGFGLLLERCTRELFRHGHLQGS